MFYVVAIVFLFAGLSYVDDLVTEINPDLTMRQRFKIVVLSVIILFFAYTVPEVWALR